MTILVRLMVSKNYLKLSGIKISNLDKQIQETFEYI